MFHLYQIMQKLDADPVGENANDIDSADPPPPATWVPPMGASRLTWHNIMRNKNNIDYCVQQFHYLGNRIKCINTFTGGPFLE